MIVVISSPAQVEREQEILLQLFTEGLEYFQLNRSLGEAFELLSALPEEFHDRVSLHSSHLKFHSIAEAEKHKGVFKLAFISPVFDSISKAGYKSRYDLVELQKFLQKQKRNYAALGGVDEDKIDLIKDTGFAGIALSGAIWQSENPVEKFKRIREKWMPKEIMY
jgi:thiamine-phosphate pyrophosphorylase